MSEVFIDIETVPLELDDLQKEFVEGYIQKKQSENSKSSKYKDLIAFCSLTPEFGRICCISMLHNSSLISITDLSEQTMLQTFWSLLDTIKKQDTAWKVVTFNGKTFDIPFIKKRSMRCGVQPTVRIPTKRYDNMLHYDCYEILTNFKDSGSEWFSLKQYCSLYGIKNTDLTSGSDTYSLWLKNDIESIKKHCESDVISTCYLYNMMKNYFN